MCCHNEEIGLPKAFDRTLADGGPPSPLHRRHKFGENRPEILTRPGHPDRKFMDLGSCSVDGPLCR